MMASKVVVVARKFLSPRHPMSLRRQFPATVVDDHKSEGISDTACNEVERNTQEFEDESY